MKISLVSVAKSILSELKNHPCFDDELYENRDYDELCKIGGDVCTITIWAIELADALDEKFKSNT